MIDHKQWYLDNKPKYELLLNRVIGLTDILLRREKSSSIKYSRGLKTSIASRSNLGTKYIVSLRI